VPVTRTTTVYTRFGDVIVYISSLVLGLLIVKMILKKYREE